MTHWGEGKNTPHHRVYTTAWFHQIFLILFCSRRKKTPLAETCVQENCFLFYNVLEFLPVIYIQYLYKSLAREDGIFSQWEIVGIINWKISFLIPTLYSLVHTITYKVLLVETWQENNQVFKPIDIFIFSVSYKTY